MYFKSVDTDSEREIVIEKYRVSCLCEQIVDYVASGVITKNQAICLINNLANEDRVEDKTKIEELVSGWVCKLSII